MDTTVPPRAARRKSHARAGETIQTEGRASSDDIERDGVFFVIADQNRSVIAEKVAELNPVGAIPGAVRKARDM